MNKLSDNKSVSIDPLINESLHSINKEIQGIAEEEEISERALVYLSQSINDEMLVMLNIQRKIRALLEKKIFPNE